MFKLKGKYNKYVPVEELKKWIPLDIINMIDEYINADIYKIYTIYYCYVANYEINEFYKYDDEGSKNIINSVLKLTNIHIESVGFSFDDFLNLNCINKSDLNRINSSDELGVENDIMNDSKIISVEEMLCKKMAEIFADYMEQLNNEKIIKNLKQEINIEEIQKKVFYILDYLFNLARNEEYIIDNEWNITKLLSKNCYQPNKTVTNYKKELEKISQKELQTMISHIDNDYHMNGITVSNSIKKSINF